MCGGFLGKIADAGGSALKAATRPAVKVGRFLEETIPGGEFIVPTAISVANPVAGATYQGAKSYHDTGNFLPSVGKAVGSYYGSKLGAEAGAGYGMDIGGEFGDIGIAAGAGLGQGLGSGLGSYAGGDLGYGLTSAAGQIAGMGGTESGGALQAAESAIPQESALQRLSPYAGTSLGDALGGMTDIQRRSLIATQGVYGRGGPAGGEEEYLSRETNRRLLNEDMSMDPYDLLPVEEQYFKQQGYNFDPGNTESLLRSFARRGYA